MKVFEAATGGSDTLAEADTDELTHMLHTVGIIRFRGLVIDESEQLAFAGRFGRFSDLDSHYHSHDQIHSEKDRAATYFSTKEAGNGTVEIDFHQEYGYAVHRPRYVMLYGID